MTRRLTAILTGPTSTWVLLATWLVILVAGFGFATKIGEVQENEASTWLPASAESTRALEEFAQFGNPDEITTLVVYSKPGGLTGADLESMRAQAARMQTLDGVVGEVAGPVVADDDAAAQLVVTIDAGPDMVSTIPAVADDLRRIASVDGGAVHVTGAGGQAADQIEVFETIDSTLLFAALGVVIIILLLSYRSPILWLLPIVSAVAGLIVSFALVYLLIEHTGLTMNAQSQGILTILVIGAGTDYALLIVARYREELTRYADRHEAMAVALHRAGPAILASAGTVAAGMICLLFADLNSTAGMGPVAAVGIAVTFLVMGTLLPALLVICGRWIFWPRRPTYGATAVERTGFWNRIGAWIAPRPRQVWLATAAVLAIGCLGLLRLDASGLATEDQYTREFESVTGQQVLVDHGLVDTSNPIQILADAQHADAVVTALSKIPALGPVTTPVPPQGGRQLIVADQTVDPASATAFDQVEAVREAVHDIPGADAVVGGTAALNLDVADASARDNVVVIPIVLAVVLLILVLLLRAILAPLLLIATVVLSLGTALGISALLFEYVFGFAGSDAAFPLFVFVFLVALGIDYNIFLMTRVRQETTKTDTRTGSLVALSATGGVITSAGFVLAATFAVLATIPMVILAQIGIAVAIGVLIDTLIVRSVLVTALNLDLGGVIWWPSRLDRQPQSNPTRPDAPVQATSR